MKTRIIQSQWGLNPLELRIMTVVTEWARKAKRPIPSRLIVNELVSDETLESAIRETLTLLERKGYLRKSEYYKASYVQLRTIPL